MDVTRALRIQFTSGRVFGRDSYFGPTRRTTIVQPKRTIRNIINSLTNFESIGTPFSKQVKIDLRFFAPCMSNRKR